MTARSSAKPAIGVAVLLGVTAIALRGHVPGVQPTPAPRPEPPPGNSPLAVAFVVVLLLASIAILVLAAVVRWRRRGRAPSTVAARPAWLRDDAAQPWRRVAVLVFIAVMSWLIAVVLRGWFGEPGGGDGDESAPSVAGSPDAAEPGALDDGLAEPARSVPHADNGHLLESLYGITAILLLVVIVGTLIATRTRRAAASTTKGDGDNRGAMDASAPLARAAEVGLAEVEDPSREPRKAIIACYAAMERELANVPDAMPQDFDTASEVLARAVEHHALGPGTATQLVELFDEARFSPHVMGEHHRDLAVEVLQRVLAELREAVVVG